MRKYRVEFGFGENVMQVDEWQTMDGLDVVDAENAEEAAKKGAYTDGLEGALFRVYELGANDWGTLEAIATPEFFSFLDMDEKGDDAIGVDDEPDIKKPEPEAAVSEKASERSFKMNQWQNRGR